MVLPPLLRRHANIVLMAGLGLVAGIAVWALHGPAGLGRAASRTGGLVLFILPALGSGLLLAAFMRQLVPDGALARWLGVGSGLRGLVLASVAGMLTPGGPMASFPLVLVLARAGADVGVLIAYIIAWSLNGLSRVMIWELPILGADFALLRLLSGLPLPILAGLLARILPLRWTPPP